jgi:cytosine/creatinine deaminase
MPSNFINVPAQDRYRIANARVPVDLAPQVAAHAGADRLARCDLLIDAGRIAAIAVPGSEPGASLPAVDLRQGIALPRLVDMHTHIDKGHISSRRPNPDGSFFGALAAVAADRAANWNAKDVWTRMDFSLRCAFAHGTGALRTHIDSMGPQLAISWPVFAELRESWKDRIALQAVALYPCDLAVDDEPQFRAIVNTVARHGGALGGVTFLGQAPGPKLELALDRMFGLAAAHGLDIDLHVDESLSPDARTLEPIALAALRHRFRGRIVVGHCCSLAFASDEDRARIISLLGEAGIALVSLPMCNMYLQDRIPGRATPARGRTAAGARGRRRRGRRCERQHARSVLCLRRPRHAGGVPRGNPHRAARSFRSAVAAPARQRARRHHRPSAPRANRGQRARRPGANARPHGR